MRPARPDVSLVATLGFAVTFALAGVLLAVYLVAGEYASLADPKGAVVQVEGRPRALDRGALSELHRATLAYILGARDRLPDAPGTRTPLFDLNERAHLADVRDVFAGARLVLAVALLGLVWQVARGARRGSTYLAHVARRGAIVAAGLVGLVGTLAAVAFEPLFLAFHRVFFPQGNFLFDPATSNLLAVYPETYWYGVTVRVGLLFVGLAGVVALAGTALLRRSSVHSQK